MTKDATDPVSPSQEDTPAIGVHDRKTRWQCPQLGNPVTFGYCRVANRSLPCRRIVSCWSDTFDVLGFLRQQYTPEQCAETLDAPPTGRLDIIAETLERVLPKRSDNET